MRRARVLCLDGGTENEVADLLRCLEVARVVGFGDNPKEARTMTQITVEFDNSERTYNLTTFVDDETGRAEKFDSLDDAIASVADECEEVEARFESSSGDVELARVERRGAHRDLVLWDSATREAAWAREV